MALGVHWGGATMDNDNNMSDVTIEILRNIQARLDNLEASMEAGFARIDARFDLFKERTEVLEGALVDLSGRQHVAETVTQRHDRELEDIRARLSRLETRDPQPR